MVFQLSFLIILKFLPKIKKVEDSDFVQLFEDETRLKISSEIKPRLAKLTQNVILSDSLDTMGQRIYVLVAFELSLSL